MTRQNYLIPLFLVLSSLIFAHPVLARDLYVSPSGNDANSGSIDSPLKTLPGARDKIRSLGIAGRETINVFLRGGTYELNESVVFEPQDSGSSINPITYTTYHDEKALLSGGYTLTGWQKVGNKWQTTIPAGLPIPRQLFVSGQRAVRAKTTVTGWEKNKNGYLMKDPLKVARPSDIEIISHASWRDYHCGVKNISGKQVTVEPTCWSEANKGSYAIRTPLWIENAAEFIDTPGEWYANPSSRVISYLPKPGNSLDKNTLIMSNLESIINLKSDATLPVSNLNFVNLNFAYNTSYERDKPEGYTESSGDANTGAIQAVGIANITFDNLDISHGGSNGIIIRRRAGVPNTNIKISNSTFRDLSSTGIMINSGSNVQIANNTITDIGLEYSAGKGMHVVGTTDTIIEHNTLSHLPYSGISYGNYADGLDNLNTHIRANKVVSPMEVLNDGGSIYVVSTHTKGLFIEKNYLIDLTGDVGTAIYLDDKDQFINVVGNVVFHNANTLTAKGGNHTITDNYWDQANNGINIFEGPRRCIKNDKEVACGPNTLKNNHVIAQLSQAPQATVKNAGAHATSDPIISPTGNPSDLNADGKVDIFDYNLFIANFGKTGDNIVGDIDKNQKIDIFDYNTLIANFGK